MQLMIERGRELMCDFPLRLGEILLVMFHMWKRLISIIAIVTMMRMK